MKSNFGKCNTQRMSIRSFFFLLLYISQVLILSNSLKAQNYKALSNAVVAKDQESKRPFLESLENNFSAIEIELTIDKSGEIFAGKYHFEKDYLKNIAKILPLKNGWLFDQTDEFILIVNLKDEPLKMWESFCKVIDRNSDLFTSFPEGIRKKGPVRLVIRGKLPEEQIMKASPSYYGFITDISNEKNFEAWRNPIVDFDYKKYFKWKGEEFMPNMQYHSLLSYTKNIHKVGKLIKLSNTYVGKNYWSVILGSGVDLIEISKREEYIDFVKSRYK